MSLAGALAACGSSNSTPASGPAGGGGGAASAGGASPDGASSSGGGSHVEPADAGPAIHCTLDNGADPVALCAQKLVLVAQHDAALLEGKRVAASWDAATSAIDTGPDGAPLHDARDDLRYAVSIARYHESALKYGDTEATGLLDADLAALAPVLAAELTPPPATYDGELYRDLRVAAGGVRYLNRDDDARALDAIAETYGRAIFTAHWAPLGGSDGILGDAAGGAVTYAPADVATGALALIDMALRHSADDPKSALAWESAAARSLDHLFARARHPALGLLYTSLTTSAAPGADTPAGAPDAPLLAETQAAVALALLQAQELVRENPGALAGLDAAALEQRAEALLAALDAPSAGLWDELQGGYLEGVSPASGNALPWISTRASALLFASVRRAVLGGESPQADRIKPLRALLTARTPAHTSLLSVVSDQRGYFLRVPRALDFGAGDADAGPHERSYVSSAIASVIEGLTEGWYGLPE